MSGPSSSLNCKFIERRVHIMSILLCLALSVPSQSPASLFPVKQLSIAPHCHGLQHSPKRKVLSMPIDSTQDHVWGFPGGRWERTCLSMQETQVRSLGWEDLLEEKMQTHSSILAWEIPWTEEPGRLPSIPWGRRESDVTKWLNNSNMIVWLVFLANEMWGGSDGQQFQKATSKGTACYGSSHPYSAIRMASPR